MIPYTAIGLTAIAIALGWLIGDVAWHVWADRRITRSESEWRAPITEAEFVAWFAALSDERKTEAAGHLLDVIREGDAAEAAALRSETPIHDRLAVEHLRADLQDERIERWLDGAS